MHSLYFQYLPKYILSEILRVGDMGYYICHISSLTVDALLLFLKHHDQCIIINHLIRSYKNLHHFMDFKSGTSCYYLMCVTNFHFLLVVFIPYKIFAWVHRHSYPCKVSSTYSFLDPFHISKYPSGVHFHVYWYILFNTFYFSYCFIKMLSLGVFSFDIATSQHLHNKIISLLPIDS